MQSTGTVAGALVPSLAALMVPQDAAIPSVDMSPFGVAPVADAPGDFQEQLRRLLSGAQVAGLGLTMFTGLPVVSPTHVEQSQVTDSAAVTGDTILVNPANVVAGTAQQFVISTSGPDGTALRAAVVPAALSIATVEASPEKSVPASGSVQAAVSGGTQVSSAPDVDETMCAAPSGSRSKQRDSEDGGPIEGEAVADSGSDAAASTVPATDAAVLLASTFHWNLPLPITGGTPAGAPGSRPTNSTADSGRPSSNTPLLPDAAPATTVALGRKISPPIGAVSTTAATREEAGQLPTIQSTDRDDAVNASPALDGTTSDSSKTSAISAIEPPASVASDAAVPQGQPSSDSNISSDQMLPAETAHAVVATAAGATIEVTPAAPKAANVRLDRGINSADTNRWAQTAEHVSTILPGAVKPASSIRDLDTSSNDAGPSASAGAADIGNVVNPSANAGAMAANLSSNMPTAEVPADGGAVVQQVTHAIEAWRSSLAEHGTARFAAWLTPPNLGHVWVELTRSGGGVTARLSASDDSVQSLLEAQSPGLRQALSDSGINITSLDLSGRSGGDSMSQRQQQQSEQQSPQESTQPVAYTMPVRRPPAARAGTVDVRV